MIKLNNVSVMNFENAIRGMRNPMNSWGKSNSNWCYHIDDLDCDTCPLINNCSKNYFDNDGGYIIGENDMKLAKSLVKADSDERKFLRQIFVSVDITAPDYWFKEFSTYKVATVENSTSTMHKIMSKPFTSDMFACEKMRGYKKEIIQTPNIINEDTELWKVHPVYSDYEISNQGRIKHLSYIDTGGIARKEKILQGSLHADGYIFVSICLGNQKYKQISKHRLVAETWIKKTDNFKTEVNHIDGNKLNNCADNLEWCTRSENQQHAIDNCLQPKQVIGYTGKLSKEQRDLIINKYNTTNISTRKLAKEFDVSHTTIISLLNNKYNYGEGVENEYEKFLSYLDELNALRDEWLITKDKIVWNTLIQKLPMSFLYTKTWTANYEVLRNIYHARKNHKLDEWREFCRWIETLPYAKEFIIE